jgi:hypothetical protein
LSKLCHIPRETLVKSVSYGDTPLDILRDILTGVPSQDFINKGLISDAAPTCFLAELIEHSGINSNRNQLARFIAERRTTDPPHGRQLVGR